MLNLGCGAKLAKLIILFTNSIFLLIGVFLLAFGIFLVVDTKYLHHKYFIPLGGSAEQMIIAAGVILIVGISILFLAVVGFCSAVKQHAGCLTFYSVILILLLILQISAVIIAGVFYEKIIHSLEHEMLKMVQTNYGKPDQNYSTQFIDFLQSELHCCGASNEGPLDWKQSYYHKTTNNTVPDSCCTKNGGTSVSPTFCQATAYTPKAPNRPKYIYTQGCDRKLDTLIKHYVGTLIGVVIGFVVVQVVFIVVTCLLKSSFSRGYENV